MNVNIVKSDTAATLTTWIYCAFWQMHKAERDGHTPYINWHRARCLDAYKDDAKFNEIPNMYDWYFVQPFTSTPQPANQSWEWEKEGWGNGIVDDMALMGQPLSYMKEYFKKHLHFNDATNKRGEALVSKYNIDFANTIGITWRGTDIYLDGRPRIPIEVYFPFIDEILEKNPNMRIACTAEEQGILEPLFARYPNAFNIDEFISAPNGCKDNPERFSPVSGYERGLQPALMVWLFSKCAHYIKNRSSTGSVASWISDGRIVSIGHPENLGFPANTDTAEIEGKLYPLNR